MFLASCGGTTPSSPPVSVTTRKPTILLLYGAGFCQDCKNDFPKIAQAVAGLSKEARDHLVVDLFLGAGSHTGEKPTQEMAEAYAKTYIPGIPVVPFADVNFVNYKNHFPGERVVFPSAAVSDNDFGIVKRWRSPGFVWQDVVAYVKGRVGE